jgi:hypothetical protein
MKKTITKAVAAAILMLCVNPLYGGAEHEHGHNCIQDKIGETEAKEFALKEIKRLVVKKKLEASWSDAEVYGVNQRVFKSMPEWIVAFKNPKEANLERQNLYIFVTQYAEITGVSFLLDVAH